MATHADGQSMLRRGLAILATFTDGQPQHSLSTIARDTGLPSATVHRLLTELVEFGALDRVQRGQYQIGKRLWQLGSLAPLERSLRDTALPFLEDLFEATHAVVHLCVVADYEVLYLERLAGRPDPTVVSRVAQRLPLHSTGPGKVLLAHAPADFVEEVIDRGLPQLAERTITDPQQLRRTLAEVRRTGVCLSRDEMTDGTSSAAAPVVGPGGGVVAAISVVVPSGSEHLPGIAQAVRTSAMGISRALRAPSARRPDHDFSV